MTMDTQDAHTVPATKFVKNFGRYRDEATSGEVVKVASHGRIIGAFISAAELERFEALKRREREAFAIENVPEDVIEDIRNAVYGS